MNEFIAYIAIKKKNKWQLNATIESDVYNTQQKWLGKAW